MAYGKTIIRYDGTDVGTIYLRDIGQRNQLGGGKGIYSLGQDRYLAHGHDCTLISTSDVMLSNTLGVIKHFTDAGSFTTVITPDA
jgi:transketolase C-terminal domain/subunit